ncbi:MAG TPA: hypothetical protein VF789_05120 [Thermoanaerobaculia bacterium]
MATSFTVSATQSRAYTNVVHVTRKVQADILAIGDTYDYFTESYAQDVIHDVRIFIDEEVIDFVKFIWKSTGTSRVLDELRYKVVSGAVGLADDRPGGIRYNPVLARADFSVRITYNSRWKSMDKNAQEEIRSRLELTWGPAGLLDYSGGRWVADRTYSMDGTGLVRERFVR